MLRNTIIHILNVACNDQDSEHISHRKRVMMASTIVISLVTGVILPYFIARGDMEMAILTGVTLGKSILVARHLACKKHLPERVYDVFVFLCTAIALIADQRTRGVYDFWFCSILSVDLAVLVGCGCRVVKLVSFVSILWLIVKMIEEASDAVGFYEKTDPGVGWEPAIKLMLIRMSVFVVNALVVYDFANNLRSKEKSIIRMTEVTEQIVSSLERFEIVVAYRLVAMDSSEDELPSSLRDSFLILIRNLECYRPYLPDVLFKGKEFVASPKRRSLKLKSSDSTVSSFHPTTMNASSVSVIIPKLSDYPTMSSVVFNHAVSQVSLIIDSASSNYFGNVNKTIGDVVNIIFEDTQNAIAACCSIHLRLNNLDWPDCVMSQLKSNNIYKGLPVSIGMSIGLISTSRDCCINSLSYSGTVVSESHRIANIIPKGSSAMMTSQADELRDVIKDIFWKPVRGDDYFLFFPKQLEERRETEYPSLGLELNGSSISFCGFNPIQPPLFLQPKLTESQVTTSAVNILGTEQCLACDEVEFVYSLIIACAARSGSAVVAVSGSIINCTWNAFDSQKSHISDCTWFVAQLSHIEYKTSFDISAGVATGRCHCGIVGSATHMTSAVLGGTVELSSELCIAARRLKIKALFASIPGTRNINQDPCLCGILRPVISCVLSNFSFLAYELRIEVLNIDHFLNPSSVDESWRWEDDFFANLSQLPPSELIACRHSNCDPVLRRIINNLIEHKHTPIIINTILFSITDSVASPQRATICERVQFGKERTSFPSLPDGVLD